MAILPGGMTETKLQAVKFTYYRCVCCYLSILFLTNILSGPSKDVLHLDSAQAIDSCHVFVCCLSQSYLESPIAQKEITLANYWGKPVIPIKVHVFD